MGSLPGVFFVAYAAVNVVIFIRGYAYTRYKNNAFGLTPLLNFLGIFVWGDALVVSPFWIASSLVSYVKGDWYLFCLIFSLFWAVRGLGETFYWIAQQFSDINRNPPNNLPFYSIFKNDSIWFAYQVFWQCVSVLALLGSIYFAHLWLRSL